MGLFKKIDELIATVRHYQELSRRLAEEAKNAPAPTQINAHRSPATDERPLAA
jgi:hypothetical protein